MLRRIFIVFGMLGLLGLWAPGQAKPTLNSGSAPPARSESKFVPYPLGGLALKSGKGEAKKEGPAAVFTTQGAPATFAVPLKGLKSGDTVRITFFASAGSGGAVPAIAVEDKTVGRGGTISSSTPAKGTLTVVLPSDEAFFSLTLEPSSKVRLEQLKAEVFK